MPTEVRQEGSFKLKSKPRKPKNLGEVKNEPLKVDLNDPDAQGKVVPDNVKVKVKTEDLKTLGDAVPKRQTRKLPEDKRTGDIQQVDEVVRTSENVEVQEPKEAVESSENPIEEITEEVKKEEEVEKPKEQTVEQPKAEPAPEIVLPENIEKLVSFMKETGGTVEDYVALNKDYSKLNDTNVLYEFYSKTKPHLDQDEIAFLIEDNFNFDEDEDEARTIKKKKLAFKEEVAKAKGHLESSKEKYYDEIKLRPGVTQEQQKALDFFDRYNAQQEIATKQHEDFRSNTKNLFSNEFKGFDFNVGEKQFRYKINDPGKVSETQIDVNNFVSKFLDKDGNMIDANGYHKAMYAAMNTDKIAHHFYEQGKADGIKNVIETSKNPSTDAPRQVADGNVFIGGLKVKSISGLDSTKLKIKTRKFN
mgnify:FL=1|tara:strand:+ start:1661 stop:2914 length:1254 start_codon:yes stop_codon:yes gene_type:complete